MKALPGRPSIWACLTLALLVMWYDLAFRMTVGPIYTLPVEFLSHPRADAGWLSALVSMVVAGLVVGLSRLAAQHSRVFYRAADDGAVDGGEAGPSCNGVSTPVRPIDGISIICALACALGTAFVRFASQSFALTVVGGILGGAAFALLAVRLVGLLPLERRSKDMLAVGCDALATCSACKLVFCALNVTVLSVLVCVMPLLAVACACHARSLASSREAAGVGGASGVSVGKAVDSQSPRPFQFKSHLTEVGFCFLGLGLYMGLIGFANDNLEQVEYLSRQFLTGVGGGCLACVLLALSMRANPDGPYVMLPILLGTSALVFIITTALPSGTGKLLAHIAGRATDNLTTVLAACTMAEVARLAGSDSRKRLMNPAIVVAVCAAALLAGILGGGVLMSTVGLGTTSIVLVAVSLLYGALLSLGLSVQQRAREQYVIVRNPQDMAHIAQVQARAIADELGTLTPRETEVLPYLLQHQSADSIAEKLGISRNTVKTHTAHIYDKAGVNTRAQLVDLAASKTMSL